MRDRSVSRATTSTAKIPTSRASMRQVHHPAGILVDEADDDFERPRGQRWQHCDREDEEQRLAWRRVVGDEDRRVLRQHVEGGLHEHEPAQREQLEEGDHLTAPGTEPRRGRRWVRRCHVPCRLGPASVAGPTLPPSERATPSAGTGLVPAGVGGAVHRRVGRGRRGRDPLPGLGRARAVAAWSSSTAAAPTPTGGPTSRRRSPPDFRVLAIDLSGHGDSAHRAEYAARAVDPRGDGGRLRRRDRRTPGGGRAQHGRLRHDRHRRAPRRGPHAG